jgi:hypothetical protein
MFSHPWLSAALPFSADDAFKLFDKKADETSTDCSTRHVIPLARQDDEFPPSCLSGIIVLHTSIEMSSVVLVNVVSVDFHQLSARV